MKISIIVSYYKALDNLKVILAALNNQSNKNFEMILSEDDFNLETQAFIANNSSNYSFDIQHIFQKEDTGFRKNEMLNRAILVAKNDWLVFIDGDCVPQKHFVRAYLKNFELNKMLNGRRVMLGENISTKLINSLDVKLLKLISVIKSDSKKVKEAVYSPNLILSFKQRGLLGCNWGVNRNHLIEVNGFDEDYKCAGVGEDVDIEWRLSELGLTKKSVKNKAIVFHLHHERSYAESGVQHNYGLLKEKQAAKTVKCINGINKNNS